jgi:predicted Zn-dependent peptidase
MKLVSDRFESRKPSKNGVAGPVPKAAPRITLKTKRDLEQVHVCIGVPAFPIADARRFSASILNNLFGGGMSSRLFQNIRERQGLAYSIFSEMNSYRDAGMLSVYSATTQKNSPQLVRSVMAEIRSLKETLVTDEELRRAKDHLKGAMLLSLESTGARMSHLARQHLYFGRFFTADEMIANLEAVTSEEVRQVANEFFQPGQIAAAVLGPVKSFKLTANDLSC